MDKLSLYELLSFVIPGFIITYIFKQYSENVFNSSLTFENENQIEGSLILFCLAFFLGIIIHVLTFRILKTHRLKWFKRLIFHSVHEISENNSFIQKVLPFLNEDYKRNRKHEEEEVAENQAENNLFDFAYLFLEVNDKIAPAKAFQSMYFMLRNVFTISLLLFPVSIIIYVYKLYEDYSNFQISYALKIIIVNVITAIIIVPTANWLREKLLEKVYWSYYVERVHELEKRN